MKIGLLLTCIILTSCQHGLRAISMRPVAGEMKPIAKNKIPNFDAQGNKSKKPDIFVRKKEVKIILKDDQNNTGSLMMLDDDRNYLFVDEGPSKVGRFVDVIVNSVRLEKKEVPKTTDAGAGKDTAAGNDQLVNSLREALPDLSPADEDESIIKRMKMRVVDQFQNGDILVSYQRDSQRNTNGAKISVRARVPYNVVVADREITTDDLSDIEWFESNQGELVERRSVGWEDEYTLRISGFDEAKSRLAAALEDKKNKINDVRKKLDTQLINLGKERRTMASERNDLLKKQVASNEEIEKLKQKITDQENELKELRPEEKPSDNKDGASGE